MPGTCADRDGTRAASIAAPTSGCDVSSGTTIPGRTTSSSRGSTGSVSVSVIDGLQKLESLALKKEEPSSISAACSPAAIAPRRPGTAAPVELGGPYRADKTRRDLVPRPCGGQVFHDHEGFATVFDSKSFVITECDPRRGGCGGYGGRARLRHGLVRCRWWRT